MSDIPYEIGLAVEVPKRESLIHRILPPVILGICCSITAAWLYFLGYQLVKLVSGG